jgi:methyltransferase (TIGR00027 family)
VPSPYGRPDEDQRLQEDVAGGIDARRTEMTRYLQARTAFFDHFVVDSIARGVHQMVVVGAGYDGRSLRYAEPDVRWFELDHPDTQADKRARLARLGIDPGRTEFVAADFAIDDVATLLCGAGQDITNATAYVCEGVSAYLTPPVLSSLLGALSQSAPPDSELAIELALVPRSLSDGLRRSRLQARVANVGEPLRSAIAVEQLDALFATTGWRVSRALDPAGVEVERSRRSAAFVVAVPARRSRAAHVLPAPSRPATTRPDS